MPLHLTFEHTPEMSFDLLKVVWKQNLVMRMAGLVAILFLIVVMLMSLSEEQFSVEGFLGWLIPIIIIVGIWAFLIPNAIRRQYKKNAASSRLEGEREMHIGEEAVRIITAFTDSTFKWPAIVKAKDSKLNYFLFISNNQAFVIPKDAFNDETEAEFVEVLIRKGLWK